MAYTIVSPILIGAQAIDETSTTQRHPLGTTVTATDPTYGEGEFVYALGLAATAVGSWVTLAPDDWSTALLVAGAAGKVGVAMSANVASQYGWYQISGKAIGKALALFADNGLVYATATAGSIDDAVVAGDLVSGALGASAVGTPSAGLAEFELDHPSITGTSALGSAVALLTDNSGGAAADGTIGVVTLPTTITDNSGGAAADGTIAVVTLPTAITDNSGGAAADGTIGVVTAPTAITDGTMGGASNGSFETVGATNGGDVSAAIMNNFKECQAFQTATVTAITALKDAIPELTARIAEIRSALSSLKDAIPELTARQAENKTAITACRDGLAELAAKANAIIAA